MNINHRNELLEAIAKLSSQYPDWRLGQLVSNVAGWADKEIWDVEDEELLNAVRVQLDESARQPASTPV